MEKQISNDRDGGTVNYKLLMDTAMLAGEIMMSAGAETYRVEDTMEHILKTSKCESIEAFALMTGIVATLSGSDMEQPITMVKTINNRSTNMNNIMKVNAISRKYCGGKLSLEDAYYQLKHVYEHQYSRFDFTLGTIGIGVGFAMMFSGTLLDVVATTVVGLVLAICIVFGRIIGMNSILEDIFSCASISLSTMLLRQFLIPELNIDIVIISAIMPLVPGVAITNAIRDTLQGDYLSGCARILEAFLKASSIALGIGVGMTLFKMWIGGVLL